MCVLYALRACLGVDDEFVYALRLHYASVMARATPILAPPCVHTAVGWFKDDRDMLCLVLTYCEGGTLDTLLKVGIELVNNVCGAVSTCVPG